MIKDARVSESIRLGTMLTVAGGFMDAYSFLVRGGAFATAETGNIVRMGISAAEGNWGGALYFLVPVISYAFGIFVAEQIRERVGENSMIHWKEGVLWMEMAVLFLTGLLPQAHNSLANCLIAFICAMQVETFRKIRGKAFATTMCTGNLRSGTELLTAAEFRHDPKKRKEGLQFYWIDFVFVAGVVLGTYLCRSLGEKAVWFCILPLFSSVAFIRYHKRAGEV